MMQTRIWSRGAAAIVACATFACVAGGASEARAAFQLDPASQSPEVVAAATLGAWVVQLLPSPRRRLGLPAETHGVLVDGVLAAGAAARAGIRKGDVISAVNGAPVVGLCAFASKLSAESPGSKLTLTVRRVSGSLDVTATTIADGAEVASLACRGGDSLGCFISGTLIQSSTGGDGAAAAHLFEKGCNAGLGVACSALAEAYLDGRGVERDLVKSAAVFHRACENGSSSGCTSEAFQHSTGTGVRRDDARATPIFEKGCEAGSASGCYNVGLMFEKGRGVETNLTRARVGYEQGCEGGSSLACTNLGYLHEKGLGVPPDDARAAKLYALGCDGDACVPGDPNACSNLAVFYRRGRGGLAEDKPKAAELFGKACDRNQATACGELGSMIGTGEGVQQDQTQAALLYQKGCTLGHLLGCTNLGMAFAQGLGVAPDPERAAFIFRQTCDFGDAYSCNELGLLKMNAKDATEADAVEVVKLFGRACDGGEALGCANLGTVLEMGRGVSPDPNHALELYRKACGLGHERSCRNVQRLGAR